MRPTPETPFTFIDLFAGTGGFRIPFDELGGKCVFTSEWDKHAQKSYYANFNETPHGNITSLDLDTIPGHDLLIGGFPCQPFSTAGKQRGFDDTRGTMFFHVASIIERHQPKVVLLENVRRLLTHDKGNTFAVIRRTLEQLGYRVQYKVLTASKFGVPQRRNRLYIVGTHQRVTGNFEFPEPTNEPTRVGDVLDSDVDDKYTLTDAKWKFFQEHRARHTAKGNGWGYTSVTHDSPFTNTILASGDLRECFILQPGKNPRKPTPREVARLQGFPDWYKIVVSDAQAYKQFGNAVSVPVIRAIARQLLPLVTE